MIFSSRSSDSEFFSLFTEAAGHLVSGVEILAELVGAPEEARAELRSELHDIEHAADNTKHTIRKTLNGAFVTPLDREDIDHLSSIMDDCIDYMDEAGDLIVLYRLNDLPNGVIEQVRLLGRCAELTAAAMPGLRKMEGLRDYWVEINRLENEGDRVYRNMLAELFDSDLDALTVIKLKDIIETLEKAMDRFEHLANTMESVYLKES